MGSGKGRDGERDREIVNSVWDLMSFLCLWNILFSYESYSSVKVSRVEVKSFESSEYM